MKEKLRLPMFITNIIIFFSTAGGLFFAIRESCKEKIIVLSIVLILSIIAMVLFLITSNRHSTK